MRVWSRAGGSTKGVVQGWRIKVRVSSNTKTVIYDVHRYTDVQHYKSILLTKLLKDVSDFVVIDSSNIDNKRVWSGDPSWD